MKKLILISLIIGVCNFKILYSQNIDSLKNVFRNDSELNDESFKRTLSIAKYYLTRNIDSFETYRIDCYIKSKKVGNVKYEAKSIAFRGHYFTNIGKEKNALDEFKSAYNLIKDTEDKKDIIALLGNIGNSFSHINIDSTIYYYNSAGKMAKSIGDLDQYYKVKFNTSRMLSNSGKKEDALKGYIECLAFFEKNASSNKKQIAYTLGNIGTIYSDLRDHKTAINYFKRAIKLNEELQDKMMMNSNYLNLAYSYKDISNIAMARNYINKVDTNRIYLPNSKKSLKFIIMATILEKEKRYVEALELVSQVENIPDDVPLNVHNIAAVKGRLLIKMKEYEKAKPYIDKAILSAKIHSNAIGLSHDLILSAEIKAKLGDYESAYNELRNQFYGSDSIFSKERLNSMKELETKYQTEKKEAENKYLIAEQSLKEATISSQNKMLWGASIGIFGITALSLLLYNQSRKRNQANILLEDQKSEIELLNKELNHRVKNNLAFMTSLLEMQGRRLSNVEAKEALKESESRLRALSLVHNNLVRNHESKEINLKNYLEELTQSLQDAFSISDLKIRTSFVDFNIDAEKAMRKGLILNELITNSVKHAFTDVAHPLIDITMTVEEGVLKLSYSDNGPDSEKQFIILQSNPTNSLGIKMINLLVQQLNGTIKQRAGGLSMDFAIGNS